MPYLLQTFQPVRQPQPTYADTPKKEWTVRNVGPARFHLPVTPVKVIITGHFSRDAVLITDIDSDLMRTHLFVISPSSTLGLFVYHDGLTRLFRITWLLASVLPKYVLNSEKWLQRVNEY